MASPTTGQPLGTPLTNPIPISGHVTGQSPSSLCASDYPGNGGNINFEYQHIQRSALLLLNGNVYVAFSSGASETNNGWMFGYSFTNGTTLSQTAIFNSTPYGTGGGIWQAGAGPASASDSNGTYIYAATANGTLFDPTLTPPLVPTDIGDSLVKLDPSNNLNVVDFYAPGNALSYHPDQNSPYGLCLNDEDFGSGGVLLPPDFTYTGSSGGCNNKGGCSLVISADKQSQLYVAKQGNLGGFNPNTDCVSNFNNIQCVTTPLPKVDASQGYWGSPAYWHYNDGQDHYMLYYSATTDKAWTKPPLPINGYSLTNASSGPIPYPPTASTTTLFCQFSPTPSGSWNGVTKDPTTGILWAIEHPNKNNPGNPSSCLAGDFRAHAALHAFNATNLAAPELYTSRGLLRTGANTPFPTPTIFNGHVYIGTRGEVDVFGLCSSQSGGCRN